MAILKGTNGNDFLSLLLFEDNFIYGLAGDDTLIGGGFNDTLSGDDGNDLLQGGFGNDTLLGGNGNDTLIGGYHANILNGGAGVDTVSYDGVLLEASEVIVDLAITTAQNVAPGDSITDTLISIENLIGSSGDDTLLGNSNSNLLSGGFGNDSLSGRAGYDTLVGGDGDDTLSGDDGNDLLQGGFGNDTLLGGNGNDTLIGGYHTNILNGGAGVDTVSYDGVLLEASEVIVDLAITTAQNVAPGDSITDTLISIENLIGSSGDDTLLGNSNSNLLSGGFGNDSLSGRAGYDTLVGGDGDDTLSGDDGNDLLQGGFGNDTSLGGNGNDTLIGGYHTNILNGGAGADTVSYDTFLPEVFGVTVDLKVTTAQAVAGDGGMTVLDTLVGIENLIGTAYRDQLLGSDAANVLSGGAGNDGLNGRGGDDILIGGDGGDWMHGGFGSDTMTGGQGADRFYFRDFTAGNVDNDVVTDFFANQGDRIDISAIDANLSLAGDQSFSYIGSAAFTGVAGQLNLVNNVLSGDITGDAVADFHVQLVGVSVLPDANLIL